jgi:hypothetical protein
VESIWTNPAGLSGSAPAELAILHSQDFFATANAIAVALPAILKGNLVAAAEVHDFGAQEVTGEPGSPPLGTILPRAVVLDASYAAGLGRSVRLGVSLKLVQLRLDCSGSCNIRSEVSQTKALDAGIQWDLGNEEQITVGASVRHLGEPLHAGGGTQDELPTRVQVGVAMRYPVPVRYRELVSGAISADFVQGARDRSRQLRLGGDLAWENHAFIRAGYVFAEGSGETSGPALGLGIISGSLHVDIARIFSGFSTDAGQAPTYLSILLRF